MFYKRNTAVCDKRSLCEESDRSLSLADPGKSLHNGRNRVSRLFSDWDFTGFELKGPEEACDPQVKVFLFREHLYKVMSILNANYNLE